MRPFPRQYLKSVPQTKPTVLVLTALPSEYAAVRQHVEEREELVHRPGGTRVERGTLPGTDWCVALAELGVGAANAAALTTSLVDRLGAEAVLFVGVAGGLKADIAIGDVVVGTQVYEVHGGKQTLEGFLVRPRALPCSHALEQAARAAARDLPGLRAHFMPIATGAVVLADAGSGLARHLRTHYDDAGAIEMEGWGAAHAAHLIGQVDALVIRGISDHADAAKHRADARGSQTLAAAQAARLAVAVLRGHRPRGRAPADSEEGPGGSRGGDHIDFRGGTFHGPVIGKQVRDR